MDKKETLLLDHVTVEVEKSGDASARKKMQGFHEEIQKAKPNEKKLQKLWNGILKSVPWLLSNSNRILGIIEKVSKIIS